jgi:hypothetical protein
MKNIYITLSLILAIFIVGCEEDRAIYDGAPILNFANATGDYFVAQENNTYILPVWLTKASNKDVTVSLEVKESSTATLGEDFVITNQTITIPAGQLKGEFEISTKFDDASVDGKTAVFSINSSNAEVANFRTDFSLAIKKSCPLDDFPGTFNFNSSIFGAEFPVEIVDGPSANTFTLIDVYGAGQDVTFTVNDDFTVSVPSQDAWISGTYGQAQVTGKPGSKVDPCSGTLTLVWELTVSAGSFGTFTEVATKQ